MTKKKKSKNRGLPSSSKIKEPVRPLWIRVTANLLLLMLCALLLAAIFGYMLNYYHLISNHK